MRDESKGGRWFDESDERAALARLVRGEVERLKAAGLTERAAVRHVARNAGLGLLKVKRLAVLFPEA